ncbi:hypothetical protein SELMODRAFT_448637 [Selaginella moellendorffii]|uniref:Protein kinase domain-containing protein n=1 Tax=Selaginella moellendorffii TaxID=88036 RepID=D8T8S4_SELML|nr:hypothetical protein SELMODRAFT_448637 [Selaginella moellendorffii]
MGHLGSYRPEGNGFGYVGGAQSSFVQPQQIPWRRQATRPPLPQQVILPPWQQQGQIGNVEGYGCYGPSYVPPLQQGSGCGSGLPRQATLPPSQQQGQISDGEGYGCYGPGYVGGGHVQQITRSPLQQRFVLGSGYGSEVQPPPRPWQQQGFGYVPGPRTNYFQTLLPPALQETSRQATPRQQQGFGSGPRINHVQTPLPPALQETSLQAMTQMVSTKRMRVDDEVFCPSENTYMHVPEHIQNDDELWEWLNEMGYDQLRVDDCMWCRWVPTHIQLPERFLVHIRKSEAPQKVREVLKQRQWMQSIRETQNRETTLPNTAYVTMHFEACPELALWDEQVVKRNVPREIVGIDELLKPLRPLVAELRYLHFRLFEARGVPLKNVVAMRAARKRGQIDLELPYHPLLLQFCVGAASGQSDFCFFKEGGAPEDICVQAGKTSQPIELKAVFQLAKGDPTGGIDRNRHGFAKMLQCNNKDPRPWHLGIFGERVERLWFALFTYKENGDVESLKVAPEFPTSPRWDRKNLLFDVAPHLNVENISQATLQDVVSLKPEPGFKLLVRYVDTVCSRLNIPLAPIQLHRHHDNFEINVTEAKVIGVGGRSIVLRKGSSSSVIKVAKESSISREVEIHKIVDKLPHVRAMVALEYFGSVTGVGDGLAWMALDGFGLPIEAGDLTNNYDQLWEHGERALFGLHANGVYHRDVKPDNFLLFGRLLKLGDFDASFFVDDPPELLRQRVGTPFFISPLFDEEEGYKYRDDWYSLVLSFLYVGGMYKGGQDAEKCLRCALQTDIPQNMIDCIHWITSDQAANGEQRFVEIN